MADDLYDLLGVDREANASELKRAYERKLAEASRLDAVKYAQQVDAAYSVLRDERRRALYDRHGIADSVGRGHPLERYAPPRAVPFRAWSPPSAGSVQRASDSPRPRSPGLGTRKTGAYTIAIGLALAVGFGAFLQAHLSDPQDSAAVAPPTHSGVVRVVCEPSPGAASYTFKAASGTTVRCSNGAHPSFDASR